MSGPSPDTPEGVALALMRDIEAAETKRRGRRRNKISERERLLALYKECLSAVIGAR